MESVTTAFVLRGMLRIEKFIISHPPMGEKDKVEAIRLKINFNVWIEKFIIRQPPLDVSCG